jgi:hypothetical protein
MCGVLVISLLLAACGAGDGDEDPTATVPASDAQPTVATSQEADVSPQESPVGLIGTAAPTNIDMSTIASAATPESGDGDVATPETGSAEAQEISGSTPVASPVASIDAGGTPVAAVNEETAPTDLGTPASEGEGTQGDVAVGDGTTGAVIPEENGTPPVAADSAGESTPDVSATPQPAATPAMAEGATPEAAASPAAPLAVTGCEVVDVPPYTGDQATFSLTTDLNFRTGPGSECDLALDVPLGEFQQVIVIGGPVVRTDDGSEWVQIQVGDTVGWVAFEFLAPVE